MYTNFLEILMHKKEGQREFSSEEHKIIDSVTYTIQQSVGIALDILGEQNANRKHVGNRFEELVRLIIKETGVQNKKVVLKIPYSGDYVYSCETDFVFSPYEEVRSNSDTIDNAEVVGSIKTSSKDRMGKIFIDKLLMNKFVNHDVKVVGIFLNDVQRKEEKQINFTFVSGLFMVYTEFLTKLDGVYFVDIPQNARSEPFSTYIYPFSQFILDDITNLIPSVS